MHLSVLPPPACARAVLFTNVPSPEVLSQFRDLQAIGIAGDSRALTPEEMDGVIPEVLEALRQTGARILHYKVCSTFDSSPSIGSLGRVLDIARGVLGDGAMPIVVGAPKLGRYSMFGTLFARHNVDGVVHRIDRHPMMSIHPTTPMREADMRRHIGLQTRQTIGLLSAPTIAGSIEQARAALLHALAAKPQALMIDIADEPAETRVGMLLECMAELASPLFVLGSSGVEYALVGRWRAQGRLPTDVSMASPGPVDRLLVVSGSCSPVTGAQIAAARAAGFAGVALDPVALITQGEDGAEAKAAVERVVGHLEAGQSVVAHSSTGADDPREQAVAVHFAQAGASAEEGRIRGGRALAYAAGRLLERILRRVELERFVVAGGDTSTAAIKMLGIAALEMIAPLTPGAPLCRALAPNHYLDGRQLVLKGGQMGGPSFFSQVKAGRV
jgi:uncharacterized protein YgbK (DUF1537 family)